MRTFGGLSVPLYQDDPFRHRVHQPETAELLGREG